MSQWEKNKRWSDQFLPEIKRILGEYLISEPPVEEDAERNTDLIVLRLDAVRIACRVRNHRYLQAYSDEITIRNKVASNNKTELTKIVEGWGDYFFYGFANETETQLAHWILGDLKALRLYIARCLLQKQQPWIAEMKNIDCLPSTFVIFRYRDIPNFLIACSDENYPLKQKQVS
jgi:hypothetical protein